MRVSLMVHDRAENTYLEQQSSVSSCVRVQGQVLHASAWLALSLSCLQIRADTWLEHTVSGNSLRYESKRTRLAATDELVPSVGKGRFDRCANAFKVIFDSLASVRHILFQPFARFNEVVGGRAIASGQIGCYKQAGSIHDVPDASIAYVLHAL